MTGRYRPMKVMEQGRDLIPEPEHLVEQVWHRDHVGAHLTGGPR